VDQEGDRQPARYIGRLDDLAPDRVAARAGEAEPLDADRIETSELVGIDRGKPGRTARGSSR
jgi:hypothetical protein